MAHRLTLDERRIAASLMEVHQSPSHVQHLLRIQFGQDPPSRLTLRRLYGKFVKTGSVANNNKGNSGRPRTGRSELNIAVVQESFINNEHNSIHRCSLATGISSSTVRRILRFDLAMKPYHIQVAQALTDDQKQKRAQCCRIFVEMANIQTGIINQFAFSDEATFHTSGHVNRRNTVFWGTENPRVVFEHERSSPKVNVWCCVTSRGVIGPYFFNDPTVNSENYLEMLESYGMDEIPLNIRHTGYFQQDGAPAHYSNIVRDFLDRNFPNRWIGRRGPLEWPAHSPDLTPCDFWLWGMLKDEVYREKINNLDELKQKITDAIANIRQDMCLNAMNATIKRFAACAENNGQQVETLHL